MLARAVRSATARFDPTAGLGGAVPMHAARLIALAALR
jgi:hypothetical protein